MCAGDAVALYLPMTADAVALYLALVLAGCCVVSVADSFAAGELRARLDIARAKGLFTQARPGPRGQRQAGACWGGG